ncbi:MAG: hypothetical protein R3Y44_04305 [Rikenellaceae bacterium]
MRLNTYNITPAILALLFAFATSCENPYENVKGGAVYSGDPFVMLSGEETSVNLGVSSSNYSDEPGLFIDSLILSHPLDYDLRVTLETYDGNTFGDVGTNFRFQSEVLIEAGSYYGYFEVEALDIDAADALSYKLALKITATDSDSVIAGLNGIKYENADRLKRYKTYTFKQ